jgi:hypothetical protein
MVIRSRAIESVVSVVAVAVGVLLIVMLFLAVLGYCYLK